MSLLNLMNKTKNPFGNNPEEVKMYKIGVAEGMKHSVPSPITQKFMEKISTENAVIIERLENVIVMMKDNQADNKCDHEEMKAGIKHTNGDVSKLKMWRTFLLGAWTVIAFTSTVMVPILGYYFMSNLRYQFQEITKQEIQAASKNQLSEKQVDDIVQKRIDDFADKNFNQYNK